VTYILPGGGPYGVKHDHVVMGIEPHALTDGIESRSATELPGTPKETE